MTPSEYLEWLTASNYSMWRLDQALDAKHVEYVLPNPNQFPHPYREPPWQPTGWRLTPKGSDFAWTFTDP